MSLTVVFRETAVRLSALPGAIVGVPLGLASMGRRQQRDTFEARGKGS